MRMVVFAVLLILAAASVTFGVAMWSVPAALIVGGVLLAGWSVLMFAEVRG